jgi:hypothetical protein
MKTRIAELFGGLGSNERARSDAQADERRRINSEGRKLASAMEQAVQRAGKVGGKRSQHRARIVKALEQEFTPATYTQHAAVGSLADDYVLLGIAREMMKALLEPRYQTPKQAEELKEYVAMRAYQWRIDRSLAAMEAGKQSALSEKAANAVAGRLLMRLEGIERMLREDLDPEFDPPDEADILAREPVTKFMETTGPAWRTLKDRALLAGGLTGRKLLDSQQHLRLQALLACVKEEIRRWMSWHETHERQLQEAKDRTLADLVAQPGQLTQLHDCMARLERSIAKKLSQCRGWNS